MEFDPKRDYPLGSRRPDLLATPSGVRFDAVTLAAAQAGEIESDDMRATSETLRRQADVARAAGRSQLADNLDRAAELTTIPDDELLEIYTALRPGRSTAEDLEVKARALDAYGAPLTAAFVREAAGAYEERELLA